MAAQSTYIEPAGSAFTSELVGELRLDIGRRAGRDIAVSQYSRGALRVFRPHYLDASGQVCYTVINPGGAYLGADRYGIQITVRSGSSLLLTTQSATKIYKTPQGPAEQHMVIDLEDDAVLEYIPDQLIAYRDATYEQDTVVRMGKRASFVMCEVLTPGWSPDGRQFSYDKLRLRTEVLVDGKLAALDNLWIEPAEQAIDSSLYFNEATHVGMLLAVDARIDAAMVAELRELSYQAAAEQRDPVQVGISLTALHGVAVRTLGTSTESANAVLMSVVDYLRARLRGQEPMNLRKN
ncbi:urease accessory protein UreD [Glutamicibacter uratoxydans]|uniref:Urease accessory protein UreD n=1 Tax=Glutamicibacter uratoxydans TaxID=43667 RepID=A0A4Y4DH71_GLUUR|nr:urease accessory protein UreD [Glutamicibacter uratoxydans]GED04569.1 urease accessory protein UreD [Glutamicibacter uratoxydans]